MSDDLTTYQRLATPFDLSDHAKVPKGGMTQTYAPWTAYVERLNEVLGAEHWSFRVVREGFTPTECWVLGEITALIDGETVTRQQYGCEPITKGQRETATTDLLKTAASDALKKATSLIGPGLYLSIREEREAIEAAMQEAVRAAIAKERAGTAPKTPASTSSAGTTAPSPAVAAPATTPAGDGARPPADAVHVRWQRLVAEAERVKLPKLGAIKAIDPQAVSAAQLTVYADRLQERLYEAREATGAA
jgi:hypothetical protein